MDKEDELSSLQPVATSKQSIRRQIWEHLEKNNLVSFPRPVFGRIPNFKGCEASAANLAHLDVFKHAQNIKVNPDKPQEPVRLSVVEHRKNLYVPIPRLASGLLKRIVLAEDAVQSDIGKLVSRRGIDQFGEDVGVNDQVKIDLVVLGSVAVSKQGYRIGKGKGYADLEFAILSQMSAVNPTTVVVTTVHDCQVFDSFPADLFGAHDVPVDIIVTPTQVIEVEKRLPKPEGIIWGLVSQRRLEVMPVLKALKEADEKAGKDVSLKQQDSDTENIYERVSRVRYRRYSHRAPKPATEKPERENRPRRDRIIRRTLETPENKPETPDNKNSETEISSPRRRPRKQIRKNRSMIDFSLVVRNIEKTVRVRDLKAALAERGIKPNIITWRGMKGYCCLHFSKTNPNTISDPGEKSHGVDNVLGMLQKLNLNSEQELSIEIMKPISRIETTDVTAV